MPPFQPVVHFATLQLLQFELYGLPWHVSQNGGHFNKLKGPLTNGSAGAILPSHQYNFYNKNQPQMPLLPIVRYP